jgi:hypothetical protein
MARSREGMEGETTKAIGANATRVHIKVARGY